MPNSKEFERGAENARRFIENDNGSIDFAQGAFDEAMSSRGLTEPKTDYDKGFQSVLREHQAKSE